MPSRELLPLLHLALAATEDRLCTREIRDGSFFRTARRTTVSADDPIGTDGFSSSNTRIRILRNCMPCSG